MKQRASTPARSIGVRASRGLATVEFAIISTVLMIVLCWLGEPGDAEAARRPWLQFWRGQTLLFVGVLNAAFAGSEIALISLREGQLQRLEKQGTSGRLVVQLARDPNRFLATIQIGITLAGFLASAAAAVSLSAPLVDALEPALGGAAEPVAVFFVTIVLAYLTLVLGELAPKRIAMQRAERWALFAVRPLNAMSVAWSEVMSAETSTRSLTFPLTWITSVTVSSRANSGSHSGHASSASIDPCPFTSQSSWAM